MPDLKTKPQLAEAARTLAQSYELVQRTSTTFIPVHWETGEWDPVPPVGERVWVPLSREDKMNMCNQKMGLLFANDGEYRSFDYMLRQLARQDRSEPRGVLIKTDQGLKLLDEQGDLVDHDGSFVANFVQPWLNTSEVDKAVVYETIRQWVGGGKDEVESLLHHLATALAPHYSAVKYVLFLGKGRNGKSLLITMLEMVIGAENTSNITRQMMSEKATTLTELNDKLLNLVFDGEATYLRDNSMEKTLVAGEKGIVRLLYESGTTPVRTNALFVEGLNTEPKSQDKTSALQKRLVRFQFPNVYAKDVAFEKTMTSEKTLGAFLSLLIDHYVKETELADKLSLTKQSQILQSAQVFAGSAVLQFVEQLEYSNPGSLDVMDRGDYPVDSFLQSFRPWMEEQGLDGRSDVELTRMMQGYFDLGYSTLRKQGQPPKTARVIKGVTAELRETLQLLKEE